MKENDKKRNKHPKVSPKYQHSPMAKQKSLSVFSLWNQRTKTRLPISFRFRKSFCLLLYIRSLFFFLSVKQLWETFYTLSINSRPKRQIIVHLNLEHLLWSWRSNAVRECFSSNNTCIFFFLLNYAELDVCFFCIPWMYFLVCCNDSKLETRWLVINCQSKYQVSGYCN